jgi:hypothetical protein
MRSDEHGVVLLEIMVAIVILVTAGLAMVEVVSGSLQSAERAREREGQLADQERLLTAYTLLVRSDLDRRLGSRQVGGYVVNVQRPERGLYRIAVGRIEAPAVEDLVTVVYRGGGSGAQ